jgi:Uma2 family endonuclease
MGRGRVSTMVAGSSGRHRYTVEEAVRLDPAGLWELVEGHVVVMSPAGGRHGGIVTRVSRSLSDFVDARRLGFVVSGDAGFVLRRKPDTVRALTFIEGAPDLAVEVKSPDDHWPSVGTKAREFIEAGTVAVWVIDAKRRTARIFTSKGERTLLTDGALTCPALLGGFELRLRALWR